MSQKTALIECWSAWREVHVAEDLGAALVGVVGDLLAVLDAVAGVVERRVGRVRARVERGRGGDDLEGRAGRVEAVGRAVDERRRRACSWRRSPGARSRRSAPRPGSGRRRARTPSPAPSRSRARARPRRRSCRRARRARPAAPSSRIVSTRLLPVTVAPLSAVQRPAEDRVQVRVRRGQVVVHRALEPGARPRLRRVADHLRGEVARTGSGGSSSVCPFAFFARRAARSLPSAE